MSESVTLNVISPTAPETSTSQYTYHDIPAPKSKDMVEMYQLEGKEDCRGYGKARCLSM